MTEPTGFVDRTATLSFVDATRVFTITGNHDIYINGVKTSKTTASITIDDATGMNWVYYNASGVLSQATSIPSFALPVIATVYYNTVTDKGLLGEERHGIKMDGDTHRLLHDTVGTRYESGLAGTFTDTTFSIALGVVVDEDIRHIITPAKTTCNVLYKDGAADFKWSAGSTTPYYTSGGNLYYNNGNVLTTVTSNRYVAYWIFATNDTTTPIISLMGQREDTTIADARTNNKYESLTLGTLPYQEMKLLYRVILRNDATPYEEVQDLRTVSNLPAGTYVATDHGVLTGLTDDDHSQYWLSGVSGRTDNYTTTGTINKLTLNGQIIAETNCIYIGLDAGKVNSANYSIFIGDSAGEIHAGGTGRNVGIGYQAGKGAGTCTYQDNLMIGYRAGFALTSGSYNMLFGTGAGDALTTGADNMAIGISTLSTATTGSYNVAIGTEALRDTTGSRNTAIGRQAGKLSIGVTDNVFIGYKSGLNVSTGISNVYLGAYSGTNQTTVSNILLIDNQDRTSAALELTNSLIYGVFNATVASQSITFNVGTFNINGGTDSDITLNFTGTTKSGVLKWMEDEDYFQFADAIVGTKATFGSTYQAVLGDDANTKAGYFDDGVTNLDLANGIYGISVNGGSQTSGYFYDVTGNVVTLADNSYAINATGNVIINSGTLTIGSTTLTEQNLIDLLNLLP